MSNKLLSVLIVWLLSSTVVQAAALKYELTPQKIAPGTWVVQGEMADFSRKNGGNIVNTAFIVSEQGVIVIDTGPSRRYGEALRAAIATVTDQPIAQVLLTHHHPDHFLGNQAFSDVPIRALPKTAQLISEQGNGFAENMYRLVGDWMRGTEALPPTETLTEQTQTWGTHRLSLIPMSGHTGADLLVLDHQTGVLFAGDWIFYQRALTTPHTPGLLAWQQELAAFDTRDVQQIVPGHGPVDKSGQSLQQMQDYLVWLDQTLTQAAEAGLSMNEVMQLPLNPAFKEIALSREEFVRTVFHLYGRYEQAAF